MLTEHKILLFDEIKKAKIPLEVIDSTTKEDYVSGMDIMKCFVISLRGTGLEFWVVPTNTSLERYLCRYSMFSPGFPISDWLLQKPNIFGVIRYDYDQPSYIPGQPYAIFKIDDVIRIFRQWLKDTAVRWLKDQTLSDPWEQVRQFEPFISSSTFSEEDFQPFSAEEKVEIRRSLLKFRQLVYENYTTDKEQRGFIEERLEYLSEAIDRLNRFDWRGLAISVIVSIGINLTVDTESGRMLLKLFEQAFNALKLFPK